MPCFVRRKGCTLFGRLKSISGGVTVGRRSAEKGGILLNCVRGGICPRGGEEYRSQVARKDGERREQEEASH